MLTPDYLYNVSDRAIELYEQLNTFAVRDICRRLVNADWQFTGSIDWQLYKLQQSGMILDDIVAEIAKLTRKSEKEIAEIFEEATYKSQAYDNEVYKQAGLKPVDIRQSPQMLNILRATYAQTLGELRNFTKTMASVGQSLFMETLDEAYFKVISGQQSYTEAVRQAISKVASNGLTVHYPSGHMDTIETAVRRCVVTGVGQATARVSLQNAQELDTDLVLVSAHLGARPSHAEWQGKVYSISGNSKKYRKLSEATGYGAVSGLCGANCRHHFMPWIDGVSSNPYENFNSKENEDYYNKQQEQRKRERDIRSTKRELQALKESIDATDDDKLKFALQQDYDRKAAKLRDKNAAYKEFCSNAGLRTQQERLQVAGWGQKNSASAREAAKRYEDSLMNERKANNVSFYYGTNTIFEDKTALEKCNIAKDITGKYVQRESKWKGIVNIDDEKCAENNIVGRKVWNCSILASSKTQPKTYIHEMLHSRSASYMKPFTYLPFRKIEEASTEFLARQICIKEKIAFRYTNRPDIDALVKINQIIGIENSNFLFAEKLYNKDIKQRFTWLKNKVNRYLLYNDGKNREELENCLKLLR